MHSCAREAVTFAYLAIMDAGLAQASNNLPMGRARASVAHSIGRVSQCAGAQPMNAGFQIPTRIETEPAEGKFDLRKYINFVWRHWMFIGSVTALVFLIGVINLVRATPLYTATTQVLLEPP